MKPISQKVRVDFYSLVTRVERAYGTIPKYLPLMNGRAFPPFVVVLELTYRCNLKCPYCYELFRPSDKSVASKALELTPAEIQSTKYGKIERRLIEIWRKSHKILQDLQIRKPRREVGDGKYGPVSHHD